MIGSSWSCAELGLPLRWQDAHIFVSENDGGVEHHIALAPGRQAYLVCIEGSLNLSHIALRTRDAVEIVNKSDSDQFPLTLKSGADGSHFLVIEMKRP